MLNKLMIEIDCGPYTFHSIPLYRKDLLKELFDFFDIQKQEELKGKKCFVITNGTRSFGLLNTTRTKKYIWDIGFLNELMK